MATHGPADSNIKRIIIDTDCGVDDAAALLLAVLIERSNPEVHIEAITTVCGNVDLEKVHSNVLRVLHYCNASDIPVYKGAASPLIEPHRDAASFHGTDGFGGVAHKYPIADIAVPEECAANALVRLARQYKGEISLVTLGPLTNVAIAQKLDPTLLENLRELIIMGGSLMGSGNFTPGSEFNFGCDPEAMAIVINEMKDAEKLLMVPFDVCKKHPIDWEWLDSLDESNKFVVLFKDITEEGFKKWKNAGLSGAPIYDLMTMAIYFDRSIVAASMICPVYPELAGRWSRGGTILDRRNPQFWERKPNAKIVTELDIDRFKIIFESVF